MRDPVNYPHRTEGAFSLDAAGMTGAAAGLSGNRQPFPVYSSYGARIPDRHRKPR